MIERLKGIARRVLALDQIEYSSPEARQRVQPNSLLHYGFNVYSQRGDDGIVREVFRRLNVKTRYFCEFGAWDGVYLSNTRLLFEYGWSGTYIEGDPRKFKALRRRYERYPNIRCINCFVSACDTEAGKTLDGLWEECAGAESTTPIDFLSIDIDGLDLNVFESLKMTPTVVAIEGGGSWHPRMEERVPDYVAARNLQQPLAVMISSARKKGYEPICFNQNLYVIRREHSEKFGGIINDVDTLWRDFYYFQSEQFRLQLRRFREANPLVKEYEGGPRNLPSSDAPTEAP
jgi:hypothetical protein